jgi:hypothetical protein
MSLHQEEPTTSKTKNYTSEYSCIHNTGHTYEAHSQTELPSWVHHHFHLKYLDVPDTNPAPFPFGQNRQITGALKSKIKLYKGISKSGIPESSLSCLMATYAFMIHYMRCHYTKTLFKEWQLMHISNIAIV